MSLINDALKRASQSQKQRPAAPPPPGPPLQPVDYAPRGGAAQWLVPALSVFVLLAAAGVFWKGWQTHRAPAAASTKPAALATAPTEPRPVPSPPAAAPPSVHHLNPPAEIKVNTNQVVAAPPPGNPAAAAPAAPGATLTGAVAAVLRPATPNPAPVSNAAPATAPPPAQPVFPRLKLEGIFYRLHSPSIMINSQTLYKGDEIEGAKVIDIERESVTVEWRGQKRTLALR